MNKQKRRKSFIRWQGRTIEQFGYTINLILGMTIAVIGFEISLVLNNKLSAHGWQIYLFGISTLALMMSAGFGLFGVVNRLRDFRSTALTALKRKKGASKCELESLRNLTRKLGKRTWVLFWWQTSTFGIGVLLLVVAVAGSVAKALAT